MKINIVIPIRERFIHLEELNQTIKSISENLDFMNNNGSLHACEIVFAINNYSQKLIEDCLRIINFSTVMKLKVVSATGKVNKIHEVVKSLNGDILITIDDDVSFDENVFYEVVKEFSKGEFSLLAFRQKTLPYKGRNTIRKFFFDIINIRALRELYKGGDPFLFGRLVAFRGDKYPVPASCLSEDVWLNCMYLNKYKIKKECVYYNGLDSFYEHLKRVIRLETGRKQIAKSFPSEWEEMQSTIARVIDKEKLKREPLYYKFCFFLYKILRIICNSFFARFLLHKSQEW